MENNHTVFENLEVIKNKITSSSTNLIFYKNAFSKTKFMNKIMELSEVPLTYLDFDLLFSGYFQFFEPDLLLYLVIWGCHRMKP